MAKDAKAAREVVPSDRTALKAVETIVSWWLWPVTGRPSSGLSVSRPSPPASRVRTMDVAPAACAGAGARVRAAPAMSRPVRVRVVQGMRVGAVISPPVGHGCVELHLTRCRPVAEAGSARLWTSQPPVDAG